MPIEDWDKAEDGNLILRPLTHWEAAGTAQSGVLRLVGARLGTDAATGHSHSTQLVLSLPQLRNLGESLLKLADEVEKVIDSAKQ